jgi:hypothetical protein
MKFSQYKSLRNILLELFGTMAIVYFVNWSNQLYELKIISLSSMAVVFGLVMSLMVYVAQDRSGAHFDPAVTVPPAHPAELPVLQPHHLLRGTALHGRAGPRGSRGRLRHPVSDSYEDEGRSQVRACHPGLSGLWGYRRLSPHSCRPPSSWRPSPSS